MIGVVTPTYVPVAPLTKRTYPRKEMIVHHPGIGNIFAKDATVAAVAATEVYLAVYKGWAMNQEYFFNYASRDWGGLIEECLRLNGAERALPDQGSCYCDDNPFGGLCSECLTAVHNVDVFNRFCMEIGAGLKIDPKVGNALRSNGRKYVEIADMDHICIGIEQSSS